jgi:hypothetical protein
MKPKRASDRVWDLVPGWTRFRDERDGEGLLKALTEAAGVGLDEARREVERLLDDMFVETCDERLVSLIGDLVGVHVDPTIPLARQRHQVKYALHWRRRRGTVTQIETLGWQIAGFRTRVREAPSTQRTVRDPPLSARVNGEPPGRPGALAVPVSGMLPGGNLEIVMDVAWPVRRAQVELARLDHDVHAVNSARDVGLRRADGTPIFRRDAPGELFGPERPIYLEALGADFPTLDELGGELRPWFTSLPDGAPIYVPDHAIAIDPERGRVAGPTGLAAGIRAFRRYRLRFWEPLGGEQVRCAPARQGDGVFTFASDSRLDGLTDAGGCRLRLAFEGERSAPKPERDERLLVVREPSDRRRGERAGPFVLLAPGQAMSEQVLRAPQLALDVAGLNRLFSIDDEWGWDRFRDVQLVTEFGREPPPDDTVEIDVERGRFRIGPAHERAELFVRYHRRYDVEAIKRRAEQAIRRALPLGRKATFRFRDTAHGSIEVSSQ